MRHFKRTALSVAAAQTLVVWMAPAIAQNTAAPAAAPAPAKDAQQLETVIVSGRRAALATAQKIKQDSDEIVDSVVADEIGKLPDRSVSEVLQRIVGATMSRVAASNDPVHFSVEGSGVNIRGLTYVSSTLNGRETFSANQGRTLGFEDVPPELMAGVDVYKNPSAEQIEGAIGGLVNLRTALPFDFSGFKGAFSADVTRSSLAAKNKPSISGLLSNTWNTDAGKFGALIDVTHSLSSTRTDGLVLDPFYKSSPTSTTWFSRDMSWKQQFYNRTRDGLYAAAQWKKDNVESSLTFFRSKYKFDWNEYNVSAQVDPYNVTVLNGTYDANGVMTKGTLTGKQNADGSYQGLEVENQTRYSKRASQTDELAWKIGGKVNDQLTLTSDFQYIRSKTSNFDSTVGTGVQLPKEQVDYTGSMPRLVFDASDLAILNDPSKYYWAMMMDHLDKGTGTQKAWKGDARWVFHDSAILNDLRFGVRIAKRDAETINSNPSYNWASITHAWQLGWNINDLAWVNKTDIPTFKNTYSGFMNGQVAPPSLYFPAASVAFGWPSSYNKLHQLYLTQCKALTHPDWGWAPGVTGCDQWNSIQGGVQWAPTSFGTDPAGRNTQAETTTAGYAQLRFSFDEKGLPLDGNVGLRVVHTKNDADGYTILTTQPAPVGAVGVAVPDLTPFAKKETFNQSFTDYLPSLNLKYKAAPDLQFRFAASRALARPQFSQMQGYLQMSQGIEVDTKAVPPTVKKVNLTGTASGNPELKPIRSDQEDLTAEWYFAKNGSLTTAVFNKDLKDIIVNQAFNRTVTDNNGKPVNFVLNGPVNGAKGYARGIELAYQQYFDGLPSWLQGLGLQANYTYVDSKVKRYNAVFTGYCSPGAGQDNLNLYINGCDTDGRSFGDMPLDNLSRNTYNIALLFDRGPISARLAYNWRGKYLYGVALNSDNTGPNQTNALDTNPASATYGQHNLPVGLPLWADAYGQLDAGIHVKFGENFSVGAEVSNLTNKTYKQIMQQHIGMIGHNYFTSGRVYKMSAQYSF
ncbi:TonB-dependent receptor [Roseateles saccharophilus]|uniref:TonB-dependent receptor n=1 Tax=Roseateles saccharophilus TaxID=304 RepID=A0A4R3UR55_ROSSA|nr:TonB-dependent receptor [Roseateles saccharophilus]MDG0833694.1 TonB-dependent receptor [Roseateles saccharophilus]TCU93281.1 TonB-dependent receptor [Roseateles saccharophilus]